MKTREEKIEEIRQQLIAKHGHGVVGDIEVIAEYADDSCIVEYSHSFTSSISGDSYRVLRMAQFHKYLRPGWDNIAFTECTNA